MPGDVTLWPNLSGGEVIDLLGRLHGGLDVKRKGAVLEKFELDPGGRSRAYTKGNRQKVALIAALAGRGRTAHPGRAHGWPGPADGSGVPGVRGGGAAKARAGPCCCAATSCPRWRRCVTG